MASIKVTFNEEKEQVIVGTPQIPFDKSKKLISLDGVTTLYYVDIDTAYKMKIDSKVDFRQKHPVYKNFALITIPIERI